MESCTQYLALRERERERTKESVDFLFQQLLLPTLLLGRRRGRRNLRMGRRWRGCNRRRRWEETGERKEKRKEILVARATRVAVRTSVMVASVPSAVAVVHGGISSILTNKISHDVIIDTEPIKSTRKKSWFAAGAADGDGPSVLGHFNMTAVDVCNIMTTHDASNSDLQVVSSEPWAEQPCVSVPLQKKSSRETRISFAEIKKESQIHTNSLCRVGLVGTSIFN
jgi:hypothetical protein